MESSPEKQALELQYKLSIDARDKLNDSYYKWMSYYYLANAGVLLAITSFSKENDYLAVLLFATIGFFICIIWHLSCKGYYYWSNSWIKIILHYERAISTEDIPFKVYSVFSNHAHKNQNSFLKITRGANISTPKLTLIFSAFATMAWLIYGFIVFYKLEIGIGYAWKTIISSAILLIILILYISVLPKIIFSKDDSHEFI
jgi:hypothetical protein